MRKLRCGLYARSPNKKRARGQGLCTGRPRYDSTTISSRYPVMITNDFTHNNKSHPLCLLGRRQGATATATPTWQAPSVMSVFQSLFWGGAPTKYSSGSRTSRPPSHISTQENEKVLSIIASVFLLAEPLDCSGGALGLCGASIKNYGVICY